MEKVLFTELVEASSCSKRLLNSILGGAQEGLLPYESIDEFLISGGELDEFLRLPNFGRKCVTELEAVIEEFLEGDIQLPVNEKNSEPQLELHGIGERLVSVFELVNSTNTSVRLKNCISFAYFDRSLPTYLVQDLVIHPNRVSNFQKIPNCGRSSIQELSKLVHLFLTGEIPVRKLPDDVSNLRIKDVMISNTEFQESVNELGAGEILLSDYLIDRKISRNDAAAKQVQTALDTHLENLMDNEEIIDQDPTSLSDSSNLAKELTTEKEWFVLQCRSKRITLEKLGLHLKVTRERVRQIEKKAQVKIQQSQRTNFEQLAKILESSLEDHFGEMELPELPDLLSVSTISDLVMLNALLKSCKEKIVITRLGKLSRVGNNLENSDWNQEIDELFLISNWPISFEVICQKLEDVPEVYIEKYLAKHRRAQIDECGFLVGVKLNSAEKIVYTLRNLGGYGTPQDVSSEIQNLFSDEMSPAAVSNKLQVMDEALIVERGRYAIYEALDLSQAEVELVRDIALNHLMVKESFVSAKVLFEELITANTPRIANEYVLYGILQDDTRFSTKRGLMIAITGNKRAISSFRTLTEEIHSIVSERGPVTVSDIQSQLQNRKVLSNTIFTILNSSESILKIATGRYDIRDRALASLSPYITFAIEIALNNTGKNLYTLCKWLRRIPKLQSPGNLIAKVLIKSLMESDPRIECVKSTYSLSSKDKDIAEYFYLAEDLINLSADDALKKLPQRIGKYFTSELVDSDYRFFNEDEEVTTEVPETISSIISYFGF
jgi:RNA polymerase primary sigma factor